MLRKQLKLSISVLNLVSMLLRRIFYYKLLHSFGNNFAHSVDYFSKLLSLTQSMKTGFHRIDLVPILLQPEQIILVCVSCMHGSAPPSQEGADP